MKNKTESTFYPWIWINLNSLRENMIDYIIVHYRKLWPIDFFVWIIVLCLPIGWMNVVKHWDDWYQFKSLLTFTYYVANECEVKRRGRPQFCKLLYFKLLNFWEASQVLISMESMTGTLLFNWIELFYYICTSDRFKPCNQFIKSHSHHAKAL